MNNIILTEENELENKLKLDIDNSFLNSFISTANEKGISQYEEIFGIKPNPETETLDFRREHVRSRLISKIPFTERYLIDSLNVILGEGTWEYEIDYNNYELTINSIIPGKAWLTELYNFLKRTIPCNIAYEVIIYAATWKDIKDTDMTWQELMDAEWLT